MKILPIGTVVSFDFAIRHVWPPCTPPTPRRGVGVIVGNDEYSVWPPPGYRVRVTESPDYPAGTAIAVLRYDVTPLDAPPTA